jgi:hypothetical protein
MTFAQLKADVYRRCGYGASPASAVVTRVEASINETHEEVLSDPMLTSLLYGPSSFTSVQSQARYGLSNVAQIRSMADAANNQPIWPRDLAWYRNRNPGPAGNEGTPQWYVPLGIVSLAQAPVSTGSGLWAVSSSASDTVPTVTIDAIRVGGYPHSPTAVALTGTSRVAIGSLADYIDVTQFALSVACVGDISLYDAVSGGNLLAVIPRGQTTARYWGFLLCLTPSAPLTYTLDVEKELFTLTADTDEPLLPVRFHRLLGTGARAKEYEKTKDERYGVALAEWTRTVNQLRYVVTCPPGLIVIPGASRGDTGSNLGPMYPAGRW